MSAQENRSYVAGSGSDISANAARQEQEMQGAIHSKEDHSLAASALGGIEQVIDAIQNVIADGSRDCSPIQKEIIRESIELGLAEHRGSHSLDTIFLPSMPPPVRKLSPADEILLCKIGQEHPWEQRAASDNRSPLQWVSDFYGAWIPGLLTDHLQRVDEKLYVAFMRYSGKHDLPEAMDIPSACENAARYAAADEASEAEFLAAVRERLDIPNLRVYRGSNRAMRAQK